MGIRYYAYAFDSDQTEKALADPLAIMAPDPLADALGLEPGFTVGVTSLEQTSPERDFLYLDKAWSELQQLTAPRSEGAKARAAYRMFEGHVSYVDGGMQWRPWVRVIRPHDVVDIAQDLETISDRDIDTGPDDSYASRHRRESDHSYAVHYLHRARDFVRTVASEGRGFVYMIG